MSLSRRISSLAASRKGKCSQSVAMLGLAALIAGCDPGPGVVLDVAESTGRPDITISPVDVMSDYVEQVGRATAAPSIGNNLFSNDGFESGLDGWFGCDGDPLGLTADAYEGLTAAEITAGNCLYRAVEVQPGDELVLSCFAKVSDSNQWTGMGLGFSDASWKTISQGPTTLISGDKYDRYDVKATAPDNTYYASMWFYTDSSALIDSCSLSVAAVALPPPPVDTANLLENSDFAQVSGTLPEGWLKYCGGSAQIIASQGQNELLVQEGACVSQALSAGDIAALQGNSFDLSCDVQFSTINGLLQNPFAEIGITLDGVEQFVQIPNNSSQSIEVSGVAPAAISNGFVSIYSEGDLDTLRISSCSLKVGGVEPPAAIPLCTAYPSYSLGQYSEENGQVCAVDRNRACEASVINDPNTVIEIDNLLLEGDQYCAIDVSVVDVPTCLSTYPNSDFSNKFSRENDQLCQVVSTATCDMSSIDVADINSIEFGTAFLTNGQSCFIDESIEPSTLPSCSGYPRFSDGVIAIENGQFCAPNHHKVCESSIIDDPNIEFSPIINDPRIRVSDFVYAYLENDRYCITDDPAGTVPACSFTYPDSDANRTTGIENGQTCEILQNALCHASIIDEPNIADVSFGVVTLLNTQSCILDTAVIDPAILPVCNAYPSFFNNEIEYENNQFCAIDFAKACDSTITDNPNTIVDTGGFVYIGDEFYCIADAP